MTDEVLELREATEFVEHMQVQDIVFYRCLVEYDDTVEPRDDEGSVELEFGTAIRPRPTGIDYRCSVRVPYPSGQIVVDAAIIYDLGRPVRMYRDAVQEFGDRAAFMALYPYLRQAVSDLGNRLPGRLSPLPLLRPHEVSFDLSAYPEVMEPTREAPEAAGSTDTAEPPTTM
ncbi:MAG: hypothetical protein ACYC1Z_00685 [Georgenia sp.]|jgi:hypothetical protein